MIAVAFPENRCPIQENRAQAIPCVSMFDIVSDENIYNQDLSGTLMDFNPIYSNVNPYGTATPNRMGFFLETKLNSDKALEANLNSSFLNEVIGQVTKKKRNFLIQMVKVCAFFFGKCNSSKFS